MTASYNSAHMEPWMLALILKPFAAVFVVWIITSPARKFVERKMNDGRLKRLLLTRLS